MPKQVHRGSPFVLFDHVVSVKFTLPMARLITFGVELVCIELNICSVLRTRYRPSEARRIANLNTLTNCNALASLLKGMQRPSRRHPF